MPDDTGSELYRWAQDLFPICRSLTGDGVRETLGYLKALVPEIAIHEIPSGTPVMDWTVPDEWNIRDGYIADLAGNKLIDFAENNLHVMGYSVPINKILELEELEEHLFSLPDQPNAIPYVTSYYSKRWGFCLTENQRSTLGTGPFKVVIDSKLEPGFLTYGELVVPGEIADEILLTTYICHPSMANNELSGPLVTTALARWIKTMTRRRYTYRILFTPETIGSIAYLAEHLQHLKTHVKAGWVITCIGDDRTYSYLPSRLGNTVADKVSLQVLHERGHDFVKYSFLDRGSDERQWCAPGVDLPVASLMRSKYDEFPEYHTSLDDLTVVTPKGLQGGLDLMKDAIRLMEVNAVWEGTTLGEPQLGRRGLYPNASTKGSIATVYNLMNVVAYCDGDHDMIDIARLCGITTAQVVEIIGRLAEPGLVIRRRGPAS